MVYNPSGAPPPPVTEPESAPWYKEHIWVLLIVVGIVGLAIGLASAPGKTTTVAKPGPTVTATPVVRKVVATHTVVVTPPVNQFTDGVYRVGLDIPPGAYRTTGGEHCYYAVLNSLDSNDIARSDNPRGSYVVQVDSGEAFEISGGCRWSRIG